jgi:hypothetical protein
LVILRPSIAYPDQTTPNARPSVCKKVFGKISKIRTLSKYNPGYQTFKAGIYNSIGFMVSGWPIWHFPELHMFYRNKLSENEKLQLQRIIEKDEFNTDTKLNSYKKNIKQWNSARSAWAMALALALTGQAVNEIVPLEYIAHGKSGIVEYRVEAIEKLYIEKLGEKLDADTLASIRENEQSKSLIKLLNDAYKDSLTRRLK